MVLTFNREDSSLYYGHSIFHIKMRTNFPAHSWFVLYVSVQLSFIQYLMLESSLWDIVYLPGDVYSILFFDSNQKQSKQSFRDKVQISRDFIGHKLVAKGEMVNTWNLDKSKCMNNSGCIQTHLKDFLRVIIFQLKLNESELKLHDCNRRVLLVDGWKKTVKHAYNYSSTTTLSHG